MLKLDVTQPHEILSVFSQAKVAFGRIDVVFNNAGIAAADEVEGTSDDLARKLFETNFFGAANVTREAVRFFREENVPGVVITNSSIVGIRPTPCGGYYSATKHGMSQSAAYSHLVLLTSSLQLSRLSHRPSLGKLILSGTSR